MNRRKLLLLGFAAALAFGLGSLVQAGENFALKGYDPVAYFTEGRPMTGDPQFRYEWDGAVYQFASETHLQLFVADPDRYVPQFRHLCTVALSRGVNYPADPNHWVVYDDRLYLFGGAEGPARFLADPVGTMTLARSNRERQSKAAVPTLQ